MIGILPPSSILPPTDRNSSSVCNDGSFFTENSSKSGGGSGGGGVFDVFVPGKRRADGSMVSADLHNPSSMLMHSSTSSTGSAFAPVAGGSSCSFGHSNRGRGGTNTTGTGTMMIRCHGNWNLTSVRTGRLSCCKPNMQNMPNQQVVAGQLG